MADPFTDLMAFANDIDAGKTPSPLTKSLRIIAGVIAGNQIMVNAALTINAANCSDYWGRTLVFGSAQTVTFAAGLPTGFACAFVPPGSGNGSIASDGTMQLNGATTTLTRASASNAIFAAVAYGQNKLSVSGS